MKKGIIAITLLISGALLLRPVTTTSFAKDIQTCYKDMQKLLLS